jgi:hypothetical protein
MPVLIRSDAEDPAGGYPTGKLTIFDALFGDRSNYQDTVALLIEHLHYVWASREIALRRNGNEGEPSVGAPIGKTAVKWEYMGVAARSTMPNQVNLIDCGLFTCKAVENLVDGMPLKGNGDGSRRGGFCSGENAEMNRRRLIVLIAQDAGWADMPAAAER